MYLHQYMNDAEFAKLQWYLIKNPETGKLIPGSGGLRKLRWAGKNRGKRGGSRIIYYYKPRLSEIWLLAIYAKNEASDLSNAQLKLLKELLNAEN